MSRNKSLHKARTEKNDEFYTQYSSIDDEVKNYVSFFKGKKVYCNCDNPNSNFVKFFVDNYHSLELSGFISTGYVGNGNGDIVKYDGNSVVIDKLCGDGDFRSDECIKYLEECDVVVTNPPFSGKIFREYINTLVKYDKKFLVLGNMNAVTYSDIFCLIKNNKIWWGCSTKSSARNMWFICPDDYIPSKKGNTYKEEYGVKYRKIQGIEWYTNIEHGKRFSPINLVCEYSPEKYPRYDNYDAIEVDKIKNIPCDYYGEMGVPITFLDKYSPKQFEIIGIFNNFSPRVADRDKGQIYGDIVYVPTRKHSFRGPVVNGNAKYFRIIIKRLA